MGGKPIKLLRRVIQADLQRKTPLWGVGEGLKCWAGPGRVGERSGGAALISREEMLTPEHWVATWR